MKCFLKFLSSLWHILSHKKVKLKKPFGFQKSLDNKWIKKSAKIKQKL